MNEIKPVLKQLRLMKSHNTFYLRQNDNWGLINFQQSRRSAAAVFFTINVGISSTALRNFFGDNVSKKPEIEECHWRKRIGHIFGQQDYWWKIDNESINGMSGQIVKVIGDYAIPEIQRHISDEKLEEAWLRGVSDGLTDLERFVNLTSLLKLHNKSILPEVVTSSMPLFKGKPYESTALIHLRKIGLL